MPRCRRLFPTKGVLALPLFPALFPATHTCLKKTSQSLKKKLASMPFPTPFLMVATRRRSLRHRQAHPMCRHHGKQLGRAFPLLPAHGHTKGCDRRWFSILNNGQENGTHVLASPSNPALHAAARA